MRLKYKRNRAAARPYLLLEMLEWRVVLALDGLNVCFDDLVDVHVSLKRSGIELVEKRTTCISQGIFKLVMKAINEHFYAAYRTVAMSCSNSSFGVEATVARGGRLDKFV